MSIALFPGSFDPLTNGHLDVIRRASKMFDTVVVGVGNNTSKQALFTPEEKIALISVTVADLDNVEVAVMHGLTVQFMAEINAGFIVRGLRNSKDFEYERDIAGVNSALADVETILLLSKPENQNISSSMVKEIGAMGADNMAKFVPKVVVDALKERLN
ncbi:MAG: pantetheine-phosphate adenylyltransferase [Leuconostoc gelidum]|jgi:pantetheine-phosphate adenylyltransferase|uniref:Phosphopantetheine adenylyltransferase n=1 Tax=Leuconostoc gelidum subsp. gelidum TaxID=1607839 RepID=A0AB35FZV9_LEUGE|nr:pantetheine-phosphate adenylyltransferase [Leuconostoc gelidum]AFS40750.1 phosphopantetheine adenylyltransferase [Leuconostoc gelidum JB7]MBZ5963874.1 pantetheine-phosphate adenylyltransferase [Leuconostoc gelidum subsp. gelidum]MBZ5975282.1 pantetheine-phosphate adenylyltransferase [Leuconostoc gelidum subsp. gelidum]MBZ5976547.1 pantetheine-phosphate adenylyltransferase [Leuconostoc gelidum subsp. gelidum]MBZ5978642.1 pantetheine-phosphate adenylyltransferase [Leuconostoc gelidum subsp. g